MAGKAQIDVSPGVGKRLERLRRRAEQTSSAPMSWSSVARRAKISRQTLYRAISHDYITRGVAQRLAEALGSNEREVLFGTDVGDLERMLREMQQWQSGGDSSAFYVRKQLGDESVPLTTNEDIARFLQRSDVGELLTKWVQQRNSAQKLQRRTSAQGVQQRTSAQASPQVRSMPTGAREFAEYAQDVDALQATLLTLPGDENGRRLKLALLNSVEDLSRESDAQLPADYWEIRRRVHAGEL